MSPLTTEPHEYPYAFHIALDGNGLNGLEGRAGVCVFRYDPATGRYAYKIEYYDGIAGGHAVSVSPDRSLGFLGNTGQHLLFYNAATLDEADRLSTLRIEATDSSIKGTTHIAWLGDREIVGAIGEHMWRFDVDKLDAPERLGPHGLKLPHAMKTTASGRYLVYGGMDHPGRGEAREVGIFDLHTGTARRVNLPATCWHVAVHPREDRFYALSCRVLPQEGHDWHEWAMAYLKEYVFEIDAEQGQVLRHWTAPRETPAHINSDVCVSDRELIYCNGGSGTIVMIDLDDLSTHRIIDERPALPDQLIAGRQALHQVTDAFTRGSPAASSRHFLSALRISRGTLLDSVYACQLSADQTLLFTANRGLNTITVYDYPANTVRLRVRMPELRQYVDGLPWWHDPRLGFHHSSLISPL
ncbi:YncE family protein [Streptomyces decoyicus]|uniref:YncE family protein n=1 Tax=Streptomyces decoyicus TaxID=249567 RepID=UPI003638C755